jgi:hypothetical protein
MYEFFPSAGITEVSSSVRPTVRNASQWKGVTTHRDRKLRTVVVGPGEDASHTEAGGAVVCSAGSGFLTHPSQYWTRPAYR